MRRVKCSQISNNKNMLYIEKICLDRYVEAKLNQEDFQLDKEPIKKYEIYELCLDTPKIMLCETKYFAELKEQERYYDKNIAFKIYDLMLQLHDNVINSFPELIDVYEEEIDSINYEINKLKEEDEKKFQEAVKIYTIIKETEFFEKFKENYEFNKKENATLKEKLSKSNQVITNLLRKLEISLDKYEELKCKKSSFKQKIDYLFCVVTGIKE